MAKNNKSKSWIVVGIALAVLAAGAVIAFVVFEKSAVAVSHAQAPQDAPVQNLVIPLEPLIVNLMDQGELHFLKTSLQVEISKEFAGEAQKAVPKIKDAIIILLSHKSTDTFKDPSNRLRFKDEVVAEANRVLGAQAVKDVYITDCVMQ